jgi:pimeloyl-ACP methyl ester carboxylesterase
VWPGRPSLTLADGATLVEPILREVGPVHLVGHSYGGAVALKVAELYPRSVRSLVAYEPVLFRWLCDADPASDAARAVIDVAAAIRKALHARSYTGAARPFVDYWSGTGAWVAMPESRRQAVAARMGSVLPHFDAVLNDDRFVTALLRIEAPMLLVTGASTVASTRRIGEMLRAALPRAEHALLPGMGHMGPITHADAVNGCIAGFLQSRWSEATRLRAAA